MHASGQRLPRPTSLALLIGLAFGMVGCSSFNRDWKAAREGRTEGIEGRWQGTWRSDVTAHTEQLRCLLTPSGTNHMWDARFQAKYRKLIRLTFSYTVPLTVTNQERGHQFAGAADLGWLAGGRYSYRGRATSTNFFATYESQYDRGVFEMVRPVEERPMPASGQR